MSQVPKIKGYSIKKKIGSGGMAGVYLALQKKLNRLVAIKIYVPDIFGDQRNARRFLKEAKILTKLNHPNIVPVYEVGESSNCYFISMEHLQSNLKEKIRRNGKIAPDKALHILLQISDALFYIHNKGLIHRDIKPENIMFKKNGAPVLVDFGIAKGAGSRTKLTRTGASIGTPQYMSPEQCALRIVDLRSDIYSLGVVFFEMLTGKVPYTAKDFRTIIMKHIQAPIPQLPLRLKKYQSLINRMMEKKKANRLRSKNELQEIAKNLLNIEHFEGNNHFKKTKKSKNFPDAKTMVYRSGKGTSSRTGTKTRIRKTSPGRITKKKKTGETKRVIKITFIFIFFILLAISLFLKYIMYIPFKEQLTGLIIFFSHLYLFIKNLFTGK